MYCDHEAILSLRRFRLWLSNEEICFESALKSSDALIRLCDLCRQHETYQLRRLKFTFRVLRGGLSFAILWTCVMISLIVYDDTTNASTSFEFMCISATSICAGVFAFEVVYWATWIPVIRMGKPQMPEKIAISKTSFVQTSVRLFGQAC